MGGCGFGRRGRGGGWVLRGVFVVVVVVVGLRLRLLRLRSRCLRFRGAVNGDPYDPAVYPSPNPLVAINTGRTSSSFPSRPLVPSAAPEEVPTTHTGLRTETRLSAPLPLPLPFEKDTPGAAGGVLRRIAGMSMSISTGMSTLLVSGRG